MADSIRERAVKALVASLEDQRAGLPAADPFDFHWDVVRRYPLGDSERRERRAIAVIEGDETKRPKIGLMTCFLPIELEIFVLLDPDDEPAECLNEVFLNVQRNVRQDITLGALVINVRETGNTYTVDSFEDRQIEASVFVEIEYQHYEDDPREIRQGITPA